MYAIVKTGGKQYRVERGQTLLVERLPVDEGANVALQPVLYRSDEAVFDAAELERVRVTAKVVAHVRGPKLRVFKFKPKRGYKRRTGHRQDLTRIEVTEIELETVRSRDAAKASPDDTAASPAAASPVAASPAAASPAPADAAAEATPADTPKEAGDGS
jgi:large subunit ribosomal protein L21